MSSRRSFLKGAGVTLALPFLNQAFGQTVNVPKRLVVFINGEGNLNHSQCDLWTPPKLANDALALATRPMLDMLAPHEKKMVVIRGIDNAVHDLYSPGNGHTGPGHTFLNAHLPRTAVDAGGNLIPRASQSPVTIGTRCMGPSIDHYIASKLGGPDSLHLAVTDPSGGEYHPFYKTTKDPDGTNTQVEMQVDPVAVFNQYLAPGVGTPKTRLERYAGKRRNVLDAVRESFNDLYAKVGHDDRLRLEQHAQRISDLQATLSTVAPVTCSGLMQNLPAGFPTAGPRWGNQSGPFEKAISIAQIDNLVQLLACGARNVGTLTHDNYDGPPMSWLANEADVPVADRSFFPITGIGWHARVHRDQGSPANHPVLVNGFRIYGKQFKYLLDRMDGIVEPNGKTLLDNSLVLWISEFGDGGSHSPNNLPVVLAGGLQGALTTGRFLDMSVRAGQATRYTTGDLHTSILKLFGFNETFGFTGATGLNHGGIPGLA